MRPGLPVRSRDPALSTAPACAHNGDPDNDQVPARVDATYRCGAVERGVHPASSIFDIGDCNEHGNEEIVDVVVTEWQPWRPWGYDSLVKCGLCGTVVDLRTTGTMGGAR